MNVADGRERRGRARAGCCCYASRKRRTTRARGLARSRAGARRQGRGGVIAVANGVAVGGTSNHGRRRVGRDDDVQVHVGEADARGGGPSSRGTASSSGPRSPGTGGNGLTRRPPRGRRGARLRTRRSREPRPARRPASRACSRACRTAWTRWTRPRSWATHSGAPPRPRRTARSSVERCAPRASSAPSWAPSRTPA